MASIGDDMGAGIGYEGSEVFQEMVELNSSRLKWALYE
jgi:hypothetical protein